MIDNLQKYEIDLNHNGKEDEYVEKAVKDADSNKQFIEKVRNAIFKMGLPYSKDVMNYLRQRLYSKEPRQNQDKNAFDSLDKSFSDEVESLFISEVTDKDDDENGEQDDEITVVKKAFSDEEIVIDNSENSSDDYFSNNTFHSGGKVIDQERTYCDNKGHNVWSLIETQQTNKFTYLQSSNNTKDAMMEIVRDDHQFVEKSRMESEESYSDEENKVNKIVQEKQDFENVEKYILPEKQDLENAEMALCETPYIFMLKSEPLSDISIESLSPPPLHSSVFLPGAGERETIVKTSYSLPSSFGSYIPFKNNRLSLEWIHPRNFGFPCNIIESRQTNSLHVSSYMQLPLNDELISLPERKFFPIERKTCNIMFPDSLGVNVYRFSFSKKCFSKDVDLEGMSYNDFAGYKERDSQNFEGGYKMELEDFKNGFAAKESLECLSWPSFVEKKSQECLSGQSFVEKESQECLSRPSFVEKESLECTFWQTDLDNEPENYSFGEPKMAVYSHDGTRHLEITYDPGNVETDFVNQNNEYEKESREDVDAEIQKEIVRDCEPKDAMKKGEFNNSLNWKQDTEENPQENCQRHRCNEKLKDLTKALDLKDEKRRQSYSTRKELTRAKKELKKKFKYDVRNITLSQKKCKRSDKKQKNRKQKLKSCKSSGCLILDLYKKKHNHLKNTNKKERPTHPVKDDKGNLSHITGDGRLQLNSVQAKFCNRSGGESGHGHSGRGAADGAQGNGNVSSNREAGFSGQYGNGSSSGGGGNNNNDRRNNLSGNNIPEKENNSNDKSKKNKKQNSGAALQIPDDMNINVHEDPASSLSLPQPRLDPEHVAKRLSVEKARNNHNTDSLQVLPPGVILDSGQNEGVATSEAAFPGVQTLLAEGEEAPVIQHAAVSVDEFCDLLGDATHCLPSDHGVFLRLNKCLSPLMHDLTLASKDEICCPCLVLSQLLIHMADPEHDGFRSPCDPCSQIFNLILRHCTACIESGRQESRFTQSDLCYKICKCIQWKVDLQSLNLNRLKSKVQKYCDKVLGSSNMIPLRLSEIEDSQVVMGEIGNTYTSEATSTNLSSSATLSLNGNLVTTETGEQDSTPPHHEEPLPFSSSHVPFANPPISTATATSFSVVAPCIGPAGSSGSDSTGHMRLTRKPSQSRKLPAIPPSIVEETQPLEHAATENEGRRDDIENIIYQRFASKNDDPYETTKTYGQSNRYGSLPLGNVHDVEQFFSVSTQPQGSPGIGEVVYGHGNILKVTARYWDGKREHCERTGYCPYQLREEGVILADQKENFRILHTRYQKHHQWEKVSHLGNGMSGKCHLAIDLKTNFKFCCKKIHLLRYAEEELTLWSDIHSPYIVRLYGALRHGVKIYIFSEFIDGGSLAACIEEQKRLGRRLSHWSAINYFQQLLKALAFLQSKNILHEDIKADNILLRRNSTFLAVTDFGTSRHLQDPKELRNKSPVGSPTHWSPEKASMEGHGFPADLWAAVCVLVHMLSGEPPWVKRFMRNAAILNYVIYTRSPPMEDVPKNVELVVRNLIERGFVKDPPARPSPSELLRDQAFSILDNGTPETYFSTLASVAHSGLLAVPRAPAGSGQLNVKNDDSAAAPNTLDLVPEGASVLFEATVTTGPYQESDSRPDHINQTSDEKVEENSTTKTKTDIARQKENKNDESDHRRIESNANIDGQIIPPETLANKITLNNNLMSIGVEITASGSSTGSKVHQLLEPLDINKLLPQFSELLESGDSINQNSIVSFFADSYSTKELSETRQPGLQVYKPEERGDELPKLSIFDASWEASGEVNERKGTPFVMPENMIPSLISTGVLNLPLRNRLLNSQHSEQTQAMAMLSSESDDCTSAELFEIETAARNSDTVLSHSGSVDTPTRKESSSSLIGVYPSGGVSPTASTSSTYSFSGASSLQQRKPTNLTLNVDCHPSSSPLTHSQSYIHASSGTSISEVEPKHRASTWSNISSSSHTSHQSSSTPSSSHAGPVYRKASGTGTSIPSTASSGHSKFSFRNSVREEQERLILELTTELNPFSPTSIESDKSCFEYQQPELTNNEDGEQVDTLDMQTLCKTMLDDIDESKLVGHNLKFINEDGNHLFTMRIEELPSDWKRLITSVRQGIQQSGYSHFSIHHLDNKLVKFSHHLTARDFKVVHRQGSDPECWCQHCQTMY